MQTKTLLQRFWTAIGIKEAPVFEKHEDWGQDYIDAGLEGYDFLRGENQAKHKINCFNSYPDYIKIDEIRSKARGMSINDPKIKHYAETMANQVVGTEGSTIEYSITGEKSPAFLAAEKKITREWSAWCKAPTRCGNLDFLDLQKLIVRGLAIDGEVLIRKLAGVEPMLEYVDVAAIDTQKNTINRSNGMLTAYGFTFDNQGRRTAITFRQPSHRGYNFEKQTITLAASAFIYEMAGIMANQPRGIPPVSAGLAGATLLGQFDFGAIQAMLLATKTSPVIETTQVGGINPRDAGRTTAEKLKPKDLKLQAGQILKLFPGQKMTSYSPNSPNFAFKEFAIELMKRIAQAMGLSYNAFTGDWTQTSYSSSKASTVMDREHYGEVQRKLNKIIYKIYCYWVGGKIPVGLTEDERYALMNPSIESRAWPMLDYGKELNPLSTLWTAGGLSLKVIAKKMGVPYEPLKQQILDEKAAGISPYHYTDGQAAGAVAPGVDELSDDDKQDALDDEKLQK